jgi:hypothetical protein
MAFGQGVTTFSLYIAILYDLAMYILHQSFENAGTKNRPAESAQASIINRNP